MADPIADLLTRVRNSGRARHRFVEVPFSKIKLAIVDVLHREGYIAGFLKEEGYKGKIRIYLKYRKGQQPVITGLARLSKQSCRKYAKHNAIPRVLGGMGMTIVSTSKGLMTSSEAYRQRVGGELLCKVW